MIPAKPTIYQGIMFRSRLEARWAVFFDTLEITWEYEPRKVRLWNLQNYMPDFRIMGDYWIEVKPKWDMFGLMKTKLLSDTLEDNVILLCGDPWMTFNKLNLPTNSDYVALWANYEFEPCLFTQCSRCNEIRFESRSVHLYNLWDGMDRHMYGCCAEKPCMANSETLISAYRKASNFVFDEK